MRVMDWLFPGVELARREALARINAMRRQMDDAHQAEQPIRDLIAEVLPLIQAAEMAGARPTIIEIPRERRIAATAAKAESDAISGRPMWLGHAGPETLFGLTVVDGPEMRVR